MRIRKKIMTIQTALDILTKWEKQLAIFKNTHNPYQTAFKQVMSRYVYYDKSFFYKELKPFLVGSKNILQLDKEEYISKKEPEVNKISNKDRIDVTKILTQRIKQNWGNDPDMYNRILFD